MIIDMTAQFVPVFWGMVSLLVLCAGAIAATPVIRRFERPQLRLTTRVAEPLHPAHLAATAAH